MNCSRPRMNFFLFSLVLERSLQTGWVTVSWSLKVQPPMDSQTLVPGDLVLRLVMALKCSMLIPSMG